MQKSVLSKFVVLLFLFIWSWLNVSQLYAQISKIPALSTSLTAIQFSNHPASKCLSEDLQQPVSFNFLSEAFSEKISEEDIDEKEQEALHFLSIYYKICSEVLTQNQQIQLWEVLQSYQEISHPPFFLLYRSFKDFLV